MPRKSPPAEIDKEYIQLLESKLQSWQTSLALVRKWMKDTGKTSLMVEHKKTGELGLDHVDKYIQKIQQAACKSDDD